MQQVKHAYQILSSALEDHMRFVFPSALPLPIQQRRFEVIQSRMRALAWILAVTIPAWSLLDALAFPTKIWLSFFEARVLTSIAFLFFLLFGKKLTADGIPKIWVSYLQLAIVFILPTLLYVFCIRLPDPLAVSTPFATAITNSYYLLPFVILACLGCFPLTPMESACIVMPFLAAYYLTTPGTDVLLWSSELGIIWVMFLMAVVSIIISYTQLRMLGQLVFVSAYDLLTDCLGRRSGEEIVKALWHYSVRKKSNLAIACLDLDHFKRVNDSFGHQAGDEVLSRAASCMKRSLRKSDFVIRWGGEEFLIVMPDATIESATIVMQRMAEAGLGNRPDGMPQTVSIGVAERVDETAKDEKSLIKKADERLYKAKSDGRARIISNHSLPLSGT